MSKKALLMILDGWGLGDQKKDDVIFNTPTPYWDYLMNTDVYKRQIRILLILKEVLMQQWSIPLILKHL